MIQVCQQWTGHGCIRIVEHRATNNICTHLSRSGASRFHHPTYPSLLRGLGRLRGYFDLLQCSRYHARCLMRSFP